MTRVSCITGRNCHPYFQCSVSKMNLAARACRHLPSLRQFNSDPRQRRQGSFQSESNILPFSFTPFRTSSTSPGSVIPSCAPRCSLLPSGLSRDGRVQPDKGKVTASVLVNALPSVSRGCLLITTSSGNKIKRRGLLETSGRDGVGKRERKRERDKKKRLAGDIRERRGRREREREDYVVHTETGLLRLLRTNF